MSTRQDVSSQPATQLQDQEFSLLGVKILNVAMQRAVELLENALRNPGDRAHSVFFVNAHTLNLAAARQEYRAILNAGDFVFGDGTGVRWAAWLQGVRIADNLVGTDFTPLLFQSTAGRGYSFFMLGSDEQTAGHAAEYARKTFPGWRLCGYHHGYLKTPELSAAIVDQINTARPDVLLVGMGNPLQEQWIHQYRSKLCVSLCMAIGGLFDYWAGNVSRAPQWLRGLGHEWIWRLFQQPLKKARRYLLGNPLFLMRVLLEHWTRK